VRIGPQLRLKFQKKFNCIVELEDLLLPEFMPLILTEKHNSIYQNISKSIYNVIVKIARGTEESDEDVALSLSYLLSRLYQKLDKVKLLETVHNSILGLVTLGVTSDKLLQFYQHVFVLIDRVEEPSLYPLLINNFSFLYTHLLKNEQFPLASACYKFTTNKLSQLFKTPDNYLLVAILEVVEWVTPGDENVFKHLPAQAHDKLKSYHARYQSTPDLQSICDFISSVAFTALQVYKKSNRWVAKMEAHLEFYAFLNDVSVIMSKTPYKCPCKGCPTRKNLNEALRTLNSVGGLGRLCITSDCEVSRTYKIEILRYLDKYIEYVAILKENNCAKWEKYWYDAGVHLYTIGAHLQQEKETEMFILYMQKFVQGVLQLEGFSSKVIGKNYLTSALNLIGDSFYESRDYEKCLLVTSLGIVSGECPKHEILRWMKAKAACRDSSIEENQDLQGLTLVSVFDKCGDELALYYPKGGFQLAPGRKIELLLYELRQYNSKWKSKVPMSSAFRELSQIADSRETAEVFLEIWGDGEMLVHETLPLLLQDTVKRVEAEKLPNKELLLSHLYFLQHKYRVKDAIVKHCDEMERTMVVAKSGPESGDPNAECDLVSSYDCLKLSRYLKMVKELNKSLELVQEWMSRRELEESEEASRLYKLLAKIGHEYRLHGHIAKSLQAWELALKVATKEQSALYKVQASGFIIEMADVRRPLVATIVTEAEQCLFALKLNKNFEELIVYFLCKAEAFLYVEFNTAYKAFRQALNYHQEYRGSSILRARVHLVEHKFVTLPCRFPVDGHKEYSLVKIHQANNCANAYYNETTSKSFFVC
jgi:tetratricopeptide (TPR) repeat protein